MYVRYIRYVRSVRSLRSLRSILCDLYYYSLLYSSTGFILDRAYINQLASSNSLPSSRNIVLKASVTYSKHFIVMEPARIDVGQPSNSSGAYIY